MFPVWSTVVSNGRSSVLRSAKFLYNKNVVKSFNGYLASFRSFNFRAVKLQDFYSNQNLWIRQHFPMSKICHETYIQKRFYAKGKDKIKGGGKSARSNMTNEELAEIIKLDQFKSELAHTIDRLKEDYLTNLSLRSSVGSLESIPVEFEGDTYPLSEIAQVIRKSPTLVIVNATAFPQASPNIKKSILESGMNLNPQQEGTSFFIQIPKVTKEHRESMAQSAKTLCDKAKAQITETQNKYMKKIKAKEGTISEDLIFNAQLKVREITQVSVSQAETLMKNKQNELLKSTK